LIVLDGFGIGAAPDAGEYGDIGSNTFLSVSKSKNFSFKNLKSLGMLNIDDIANNDLYGLEKEAKPQASFARMQEVSRGKDTIAGHFEIAGLKLTEAFPTYPNGFSEDIIEKFEKHTGYKVVCNRPYSGTEVIKEFGEYHMKTKSLIVYTSADSVFQIAAHEDIISLQELYKCCRIAREILKNKHAVARVIARPFTGKPGKFRRTHGRHDFAFSPPSPTMLDILKENNFDIISIGKIYDIFSSQGFTAHVPTESNQDGINAIVNWTKKNFEGLCFANLVDFDMIYGHRNDVNGYAKALAEFDASIPEIISNFKKDDVLMITSDHGCDPGFLTTTDHSREYTPLIIFGENIKPNVNLGTRKGFFDISASVLDYFCIPKKLKGKSFLHKVLIKKNKIKDNKKIFSTPHISADKSTISKIVLMPGDPLRAKFIAENFLTDIFCFNKIRNMLGYTGTYKNKKISIMGSGMGIPSIAIYSHELFNFFGVQTIIRIGSAGSICEDLNLNDIVIATGASTDSNFAHQFSLSGTFSAIADFDLAQKAVKNAQKQKIKFKTGNVLSSDCFYKEDRATILAWQKMGVLCVEMETAALYTNAAVFKKQSLALLTISDSLITGESLSPTKRQESFKDMIKVALECS
jgi:phosphopentomutase